MIGDVVVGILNVISPILPELTSCFTQIADIVSNAIVRIVEAIAPHSMHTKNGRGNGAGDSGGLRCV